MQKFLPGLRTHSQFVLRSLILKAFSIYLFLMHSTTDITPCKLHFLNNSIRKAAFQAVSGNRSVPKIHKLICNASYEDSMKIPTKNIADIEEKAR